MPIRLRPAVLSVLATLAVSSLPLGVAARPADVTVLLATSVPTAAETTLPAEQWSRVVRSWVNAQTYVAANGVPTVEACRAAGATYIVTADLTAIADAERGKRFPGRSFAVAKTTVVNCVTGVQTAHVDVPVMSDPPTTATEGDYESTSEISWKSLGDQLARTQLPIAQLVRVSRVDGPYVYVNVPNGREYRVGSQLRIYANAQAQAKPPIELTIDDIVENTLQTLYDVTKPANVVRVGDYVEPIRTVR